MCFGILKVSLTLRTICTENTSTRRAPKLRISHSPCDRDDDQNFFGRSIATSRSNRLFSFRVNRQFVMSQIKISSFPPIPVSANFLLCIFFLLFGRHTCMRLTLSPLTTPIRCDSVSMTIIYRTKRGYLY